MLGEPDLTGTSADAINRGFSKQSSRYDEADRNNLILQDLRQQVYGHVQHFLRPTSRILELNAGTGIDALHFVLHGHRVHATDLSDGMVAEIKKKIERFSLEGRLTCQQLSFTALTNLTESNFDHVFSNFGGLNCIKDLRQVIRQLPAILQPGGYVTFVVMPSLSFWECALIFKGNWKRAFRRLGNSGTVAHVEGEYFQTYYHSLSRIRKSLTPEFRLISTEGLAVLSPPPHRDDIPVKHPRLYKTLRLMDKIVRNIFPFNRCGDHIIVTFQYQGKTQ